MKAHSITGTMKLIKYFFALLLLVVISSCGKHKEEKPYYSMDPEFKSTFLQGGEGSYWIYSDSLGTYYDTVTLVFLGKGSSQAINIPHDYEGEAYRTHYQATNTRDFFTQLNTYRNLVNGTDKTFYRYDFADNSGSVFSFMLVDGEYSPERNIWHLDSVVLLGKTYYNVTVLSEAGTRIFIDPKIGIIYKEIVSVRPAPGGLNKFYLIDYKLK